MTSLPAVLGYSVNDFGAVADGKSHPLSERYATLAAAQAP
jgi:hypothetical protein